MGVRQVMLDERIAEEAEHVAEAAGFDSLEHYITVLIEEDLDKMERTIAVYRALDFNGEN